MENLTTQSDKARNKSNELKFGTWNVRSLKEDVKLQSIVSQLEKYGVEVAALQEIQRDGNKTKRRKNFDLYYSGRTGKSATGVGFIVRGNRRKAVVTFEAISSRLCVLRIKNSFRNITFVNAYAPTEEEKDDTTKDNFYYELQRALEKVPRRDLKIILGDFNAQLGREEVFEEIVGKHSKHDQANFNGMRLVQFAASNNLKIVSTGFDHKTIHKGTFKILRMTRLEPRKDVAKHTNQIDHVLIDRRWVTEIKDVKAYRGAKGSDHYLVRAKMKVRSISVIRGKSPHKRSWNSSRIDDERAKEAFVRECERSLCPDLATECCEKEETKNKKWFDEECRDVIGRKNEALKKRIARDTRRKEAIFRAARRDAKRICRRKKRETIKREVGEILANYEKNTYKKLEFCLASKKITKVYRLNSWMYSSSELLRKKVEILEKCKQYYEDKLSEGTIKYHEEVDSPELGTQAPDPELQETVNSIMELQKKGTPGADNVIAHLFKEEKLQQKLHALILNIWRGEEPPRKLHKQLLCSKYIDIVLLHFAYSVLSGIIHDRLSSCEETIVNNELCQFRQEQSIVDQIFIIRQIQEKVCQYNKEVYFLFVSFWPVFNKKKWTVLLEEIKKLGVLEKLISLIKTTLAGTSIIFKNESDASEQYIINVGLKREDSLCFLLLKLAIEAVLRKSNVRNLTVNESLELRTCTNEIVLVIENKSNLKEVFRNLKDGANELGLQMNRNKTKYMRFRRDMGSELKSLKFGDFNLRETKSFYYLGINISEFKDTNNTRPVKPHFKRGFFTEELNMRIKVTSKCYCANRDLLTNSNLEKSLKVEIYLKLLRPLLTYGCESWILYKRDRSILRTFDRTMLRSLKIDCDDIVRHVKARRLCWLGKVHGMETSRGPRQCMEWRPAEAGAKVNLYKWLAQVEEDIKKMGIKNWKGMVKNELEWLVVVEKAKTHRKL